MGVVQTRCLKCGSVFASARPRVAFCEHCFADDQYLKPVLVNTRPADPRPVEPEAAPGEPATGAPVKLRSGSAS